MVTQWNGAFSWRVHPTLSAARIRSIRQAVHQSGLEPLIRFPEASIPPALAGPTQAKSTIPVVQGGDQSWTLKSENGEFVTAQRISSLSGRKIWMALHNDGFQATVCGRLVVE
jgi:hypothetical protein